MEMRSSMLILFAFACGLAVAQEDLFQSMTVVPTPVPTSVPPNPRPGNNSEMSFYVLDAVNKSHVCLHLRAAIAVDITYINSAKENVSRAVNLTEHAPSMDRRSVCNSTSLYAKLFIALEDDEDMVPRPLYMTFEFTGSKDNWSMGNITFTLDLEYLDNYNASETSVNVTFATGDQLHASANNKIEYTRSYKCNSDQTLYFDKTRSIAPIVHINKLRVQAFRFENKTSGAFDNARSCLLDTAGKANKIVPIAVGAALAGLVVVVLIAYLIGRLRSRRQSSYEALS